MPVLTRRSRWHTSSGTRSSPISQSSGPHSRDTLIALLWPESDERHARDALNQLLRSLRRDLGDDVFATGSGNRIALDEAMVWCDAVAFELLLDGGKEEEALGVCAAEPCGGYLWW